MSGERITRWVSLGVRDGLPVVRQVEGVLEEYGHGWDPDALGLRLPSGQWIFDFDLHATEAQCLAAAVGTLQFEARQKQSDAKEALQEADDALEQADRVLKRLREVAG